MPDLSPYCAYALERAPEDSDRLYHDRRYGFAPPAGEEGERYLFGLLLLEINQAGLGWSMILRKEENFRRAYSSFDVAAVAAYTDTDRQRLLQDAGIIRNRRKIDAAIENAGRILALQAEYGAFQLWLDAQHPLSLADWLGLFRKTFVFTGPEIVKEFLMSSSYLDGAHPEPCPLRKAAIASGAKWASS
ncbi:MAG: DNA-3-methyladenine glycosylase I [Spirochaetes bacterium]|nr:DNA-3-methyladenine glycosylase I [Spirochaetota bacterium]MBU0954898.1 DNA-3-methyladenine glycosylase I [Spirochaetota bacterium]